MNFFSTADRIEIGDIPFVSTNIKANRSEALEYYRRVCTSLNLSVHLYEGVEAVHSFDQGYKVETSLYTYITTSIIVATGFYDIPNKMNIHGEELPKVFHYYKEAHPFIGQRVAIIGSANSAVDAALECYRKGADVSMIIKNDSFGENVKYWVKPDIENRIKEGSIKAFFNSRVTRIEQKSIFIESTEGQVIIENDFVLAMTGYIPDFSFLKMLGIGLSDDEFKTPHYNTETMETNQTNIFLAGVICGGLNTRKWFIENSRTHATIIAETIYQKLKAYKDISIPSGTI